MNTTPKIALLAGATGFVGREIMRLLALDDTIAEVRALVRRPLPMDFMNPKIKQYEADFDRLQDHHEWFKVDLVFSALGTTIKQAKSQAAFRKVDYEYPLQIAQLARSQGARQFLFVSALGADARSPFFYPRVKGELEEAIQGLGYPSVTIARPSMLMGDRHPLRFSEEILKPFGPLFPPWWRPVKATQVAAALVQSARAETPGVQILQNRQLREMKT